MIMENFADRMQPVIDEATPFAIHRRAHSAASIVPDHDDMPHLQRIDGVLQHRQIVRILRRRQVGNITMDEELAGREIDDLVSGHAAIGASYPEILRGLLSFETPKKLGIRGHHPRRPRSIICF